MECGIVLANILWAVLLVLILSFFIYKDRKKKRTHHTKVKTNKELEKEKAIEKEKARRGFGQSSPF